MSEFKLPKGKIIVRPIVKSTYLIPDTTHRSAFLAPGAHKLYVAPVSRSTGQYKNVLTSAEKTYFESTKAGLDLKEGDLSIYKKVNNYWEDFSILLGKVDYPLDKEDPIQYIQYKVLLANTEEIAPSLEHYRKSKKATYKYVLVDTEDEVRESADSADLEEQAWGLFGDIKNDRTKMFDVLAVFGKKVSKDSSDAFLKDQLKTMLKEDVKGFITVATDPYLETKILIGRAVSARILTTRAGGYSLAGGELIGTSLFEAAEYLNKPKNQETLIAIENKLESK